MPAVSTWRALLFQFFDIYDVLNLRVLTIVQLASFKIFHWQSLLSAMDMPDFNVKFAFSGDRLFKRSYSGESVLESATYSRELHGARQRLTGLGRATSSYAKKTDSEQPLEISSKGMLIPSAVM